MIIAQETLIDDLEHVIADKNIHMLAHLPLLVHHTVAQARER